jgi:DNA-binding response OmpR family regulator
MGLERYLVSVGHSVSTADSVKAALTCTKRDEFDLLLVDLQLRDGTGWDLLKRLRIRNPVRAIAMSGWGNDLDVIRSETTGFMRHLVKPITPEELTDAILQVMNHLPGSPIRSISSDRHVHKACQQSKSHSVTQAINHSPSSQESPLGKKTNMRSKARQPAKRKP